MFKSFNLLFRRLSLALAVAVTTLTSHTSAQSGSKAEPVKWTPELMMKLKQFGSVQVSPDGKRVAFSVRQAVMDSTTSEYLTQIYLTNADGSGLIPLTSGEKSSDSPQWSPDGEYIAFISTRSGKSNIWLMRASGDEPNMLTDARSGVSSFKWSPDGKHIAFIARDPPTPQEAQAAREKNDARVVDETDQGARIFVVPVGKSAGGRRETRQLTTGDHKVTPNRTDYDWSPDGRTIVYTSAFVPRPGVWENSDLSLVDVESARVRPLVNTGASERYPLYSPDGRWIAFLAGDDPHIHTNSYVVHVIPSAGGMPRSLAVTVDQFGHLPDGSPLIGWSADGKQIYCLQERGTISRIYALPLDGGPEQEVSSENGVITAVSLNQTRSLFGFSYETSDHPPEAYVSRVNKFERRQISRMNKELSDIPVARTEVIRWKSIDNLEIEGLLTYPAGYERGRRYPLVLLIHGGPISLHAQRFIGTPAVGAPLYGPVAALASRGYAVLRCNVRGSSGYGRRFSRANYQDWGRMDVKDLLAGVDHVIKMGTTDAERIAIGGWSYGGFLTASTITQTKRFRAAVVGAGITNLISFATTTDILDYIPRHFGGEAWENYDLLRRRSPALNVKGVTTPTLILHGEEDKRVPITQAYEFYNALKRQGRIVKMVVYPRMPHSPREPKHMLDAMNRTIQWFDKYVRGVQ